MLKTCAIAIYLKFNDHLGTYKNIYTLMLIIAF